VKCNEALVAKNRLWYYNLLRDHGWRLLMNTESHGHNLAARPILPRVTHALSPYLELTKARLTALVLVTTVVGFVVAKGRAADWDCLIWTVLGTALAAGGANAVNQCMERQRDARMERTRGRPLPSNRLTVHKALTVGVLMTLAGPALLAWKTNRLAAGLALGTALLYLLAYTPLKPRTSLCILVGAVVGAIPPVIGYAAAAGRVEDAAFVLAGILFVWQIPHSLALAWLYREDYARGGFHMLPAADHGGSATTRLINLYCLALLPTAAAATMIGLAGRFYLGGSLLLGALMLGLGFRLSRERSDTNARRLFLASVVYLPLLLALLMADGEPIDVQRTLAIVAAG